MKTTCRESEMVTRNASVKLLLGLALAVLMSVTGQAQSQSTATPALHDAGLPKPADLPAQTSLPDPLVMLDGRKVTTREMWLNERRPELIRLFQHYMFGRLLPKVAVAGKVERADAAAFGGKATLSEVTLTFGPTGVPPIHLMLLVPNKRTRPAPLVLALNYMGNHTLVHDKKVRLPDNWMPEWPNTGAWGANVVGHRATEAGRGSYMIFWPIEDLIDRGYALATFYMGDVDLDKPDERGVQKFFPQPDPADDCGTIGAWAWGLQRAVDYLVTTPDIDPRRIVVTGHSRTGKAALVAAAFDERIALAIPHQAGCGGSAPSRARIAIGKPYNTLDKPQLRQPETVFNVNDKFPHWFNSRFKEFNNQPERLPFDQDCLVALCAPRPVLFTNGRADTWINPAGQFEVMRAAAPVYRLLGAGDFTAKELPPDGQLMDSVLAYHLRPGGHTLLREDWKVFLDFADKHLGWPTSEKPAAGSESEGKAPVGVRSPDRTPSTTEGLPSAAPSETSGREVGGVESPAPNTGGGGVGRPAPITPNVAAGPIIIDPKNPHSFCYQSGERFFPMGDTAYVLLGGPKDVITRYIDVRRAHKFNFIRTFAAANGNWPFGGTPERPDYTVINEPAMQKLDWLFDYAAGKDMNIELILWGYWVEGGEGLWANQAHQNLWIDTVTKRYKDRPNLLMYTIANEFERYPGGKHSFEPSDVQWAREVAARIRQQDAIHAIGCHPSVWITNKDRPNETPGPFATYKGFTQRRPQVVWPLWEDCPVNLNVTQNNEGVQRRTWGAFDGGHGLTYYPTHWQGVDYPARWTDTGWDFEAAGMEDCIAEDWAHGKPVLNTEFGYQFEPGTANPKQIRTKGWTSSYSSHQCHQPAATRKKAWKIATAGGYFAAGFSNSWSGEFSMEAIDNFRPGNLETLYDFFTTKTEYWKMAPHLELVAAHNALLTLPGTEYVAYFPRGGANTIKLVAGTYAVEWLRAETGEYFRLPPLTAADGTSEFTPPNTPDADWVLHLKAAAR